MPVTPAVLKRHSIETRHEIEFGGPGIAMHDGKAPCMARLVDDDLGRRQYLAGRVVIFDDQAGEAPTEPTRPKAEGVATGRVGNPCLDHETPSWREMSGGIGKASDLVVLSRHGVNRVDQQ